MREPQRCDSLHGAAHLSSTLAPKARVPPIREADKPPVVLLLDLFFHRVSERTVYASCLPTVWMSRPLVVMSLSLCFSEASVSSVRFASFLSFVTCACTTLLNKRPQGRYAMRGRRTWPLTLAGIFLRSRNALSTEKPSMPLSWSQPWLSTMGRTVHCGVAKYDAG